jgi:hypothetical protein
MKHITAITILAATLLAAQADERTIPEKARDAARDTKDAIVGAAHSVGRAARTGWHKTKEFFSDDAPVYRKGAVATLAALAREIDDLKAQTPAEVPAYFRTRLLALDQQHEYLAKNLAVLSPDELRDRSAGGRYAFDRCVADLEESIDLAVNGAEMFSKIVRK